MTLAKEIMSKSVSVVDINDPIAKVIKILSNETISCVIVKDSEKDNQILGIITRTDLVKRILLKKLDKSKVEIKKIMNTDIKVAYPKDDILLLQKTMSTYKIRQLPVVEDNNVLGLVKLEDIAKEIYNIESKNRTFLAYQNIQTIIIIAFLIFLIIFLFLKLVR